MRKKDIFTCYIEEDGLETVKNQGRQDTRCKWKEIEDYWVKVIKRQSGDDSIKWIVPAVDCLSYQVDEKPFEIYEEDFIKTMMDYMLFEKGVDSDEFGKSLLPRILYSNQVNIDNKTDC